MRRGKVKRLRWYLRGRGGSYCIEWIARVGGYWGIALEYKVLLRGYWPPCSKLFPRRLVYIVLLVRSLHIR